MKHDVVTRSKAAKSGFVPITTGYNDNEAGMLRNALNDLRGIAIMLVEAVDGIEIWRKKTDVKFSRGGAKYW